jgi:hypothetical protein
MTDTPDISPDPGELAARVAALEARLDRLEAVQPEPLKTGVEFGAKAAAGAALAQARVGAAWAALRGADQAGPDPMVRSATRAPLWAVAGLALVALWIGVEVVGDAAKGLVHVMRHAF